jgi:hypothetical protein
MLADLTALREHLLSSNTPEQLAEARQRLGWYTRRVIDRVTAPCLDLAGPIRELLGRHLPARRGCCDRVPDTRLAIAAVLVHAAFDLVQAALREPARFAHQAYDLFFREDRPLDMDETPPTLAGAVARAAGRGETALAALIAREASTRLGLAEPTPRLTREVRRRLECFVLIAYEAQQMLARQEPPGWVASSAPSRPAARIPRPDKTFFHTHRTAP